LYVLGMTCAQEPNAKPGPKPRPPLRAADIQRLKYFKPIKKLLRRLHDHKDCHNRKLHYDELLALLLLHFFNPVLTGLRSLQQASKLRKVQKKLGMEQTSLGSLSESASIFSPELVYAVVQELAGAVQAQDAPARPTGLEKELAVVAVDGTLLDALPRMAWALWLDEEHRGLKLVLQFDVLRSVPQTPFVGDANTNEKDVLRQHLLPGRLYLVDGGYAEYRFFEEIRQARSSFVGRLKDNAVWAGVQDRPLTEADRRAGVAFDRVVRLGSASKQDDLSAPVRVVKVHVKNPPGAGLARRRSRVSSKKTFRHRPEEYDLLLVTDRMDLAAEVIALLFRYRWTIELFFRWLKGLLGLRHLIFESENGVKTLIYAGLIASLLVVLWTGRRPTKRTWEMIQLYFQGWAALDEVEAHIAKLEKKKD
jgi:hypothetical protein